ncbi:phosphotransferase family protein [Streptomyces millisiae]|uniref:Phosphotransferase n=1 Tax=Streptomyces millisiae TaxID=3075542 RepID=A0ABU2LN79_9ACTN|nr:phosphotransferase [Streptomyces sp. DSM 44918]MDT0318738.1 phosphotransferase [Streptomyces sp. DSM 44918]
MTDDELTRGALDAFRVVVEGDGAAPGLESRSGAGVRAVRTERGERAFLKVTAAGAEAGALAGARREARFYRELGDTVPVRVPRLLGVLEGAAGVALLLAAAGESRDAASWSAGMWARLGGELAALHAMSPPVGGGWERPDPLLAALAAPVAREVKEFWASSRPWLPALLDRRVELRAAVGASPPAFVHGDCHTHNITHGAGGPVFCDWQAAGVGRAATDLAFLSVRATPSGVVVPRALVDAYLAGGAWDRRTLERAVLAEELATLVFLWPPFAAFNGPEEIGRVRRRARRLAERFLGGAG